MFYCENNRSSSAVPQLTSVNNETLHLEKEEAAWISMTS